MRRIAAIRWQPYLFLLPSFLLLVLLIIYPTFFVVSNSVYFWNLQLSPVPSWSSPPPRLSTRCATR
jgi:ABC-type sugar transport system permease subunit